MRLPSAHFAFRQPFTLLSVLCLIAHMAVFLFKLSALFPIQLHLRIYSLFLGNGPHVVSGSGRGSEKLLERHGSIGSKLQRLELPI